MIEWNKCYFTDCLDPEIGLPKLVDLIETGKMEKISLGITDYPWGVQIGKKLRKGRIYHGRELSFKENKIYYEDPFNPEWYLKWFNLYERACENIILVAGTIHKFWWIRNTNPIGEIIINHDNGHASTKIADHHHFSTYLAYGKFNPKLTTDMIDYTIPWGFLSKEKQIIHPTPKGTKIPLRLFIELQPKSILDIFAGSGSCPYSAHLLAIKWLAYEINPIYEKDFKYRFSQQTLGQYSYVLKRVQKTQEKRKQEKFFQRKLNKRMEQQTLL